MKELYSSSYIFILIILLFVNDAISIESAEELTEENSENDKTLLLMVIGLLIVTVLTIWLFKVKKFRFLHETGVCMLYGILAGLVVKYTGGNTQTGHAISINEAVAPLTLWVNFTNGSYSYRRKGVLHTRPRKGGSDLETKAVFDPDVFFYALLPPIIFYAGYNMKKRFFFRNLGAILTYAFIGTTISCLVFAGVMYGFVSLFPSDKYDNFQFHDSLLFGSLISATDPVTVLAIFHDLNVEVDLYATVFGESVLNDAVAIVLYRTIQLYKNTVFHSRSLFQALGTFILVFGGSLVLGTFMGLLNALLTKLTHIGQFPQLETALFVLMSYGSFLIAEAAKLTGIVTVLFCGIAQAHYTYNNLTPQSQVATKETFGLLNFLAENFVFSYMGLTVFTFENHQWDIKFISVTFLAIAVSRFCNIYPLSFLLNLKRSKKIPWRFQHMLFFAGLRGAVAFALAIKNTETIPRQLMLTSVLMVAIVTVIFNGGLTTQALLKLGIRVNVDPDEEITRQTSVDERGELHEDISYERSWLVRHWHYFDVKYMKPLFTNRGGPVSSVLPACCQPFVNWLSSAINSESYEQRRRSDAQMEEIGSIDDEMIDVSSEVMTRHPPFQLQSSQENLVQPPKQLESHGSNIPMDIVT